MSVAPYPHIEVNVDDQTIRQVIESQDLPLIRPLVIMKAYKGPIGVPVYCETYSDAVDVFGEETFDKLNTTYFSEESLYLIKMYQEIGSAFIVRLADDTAAAAIIIYELEVLEDADVPVWELDGDGMRSVDGSGDWIPVETIPGTQDVVTGTKLTWHIRSAIQGAETGIDDLIAYADTDPITSDATMVYPMLALEASSPGVWGSNLASAMYYDATTNDEDLINRIGAVLFTMAPVVKENDSSTTSPIRDIYRGAQVSFCIKPNVTDPSTTQQMSIDDVFANRYENLPFTIEVYADNWEAIADMVLTYEDISNTELIDAWYVNSISAKYADGRYYANVWLVTADEVGETNPVAHMIPGVNHYFDNGVDGTLTRAAIETLTSSFLALDINTDIVDASRYPFNTLIDTGHSIELKYDMIDFLGTREDVFLVLATQDLDDPLYDIATEMSMASALRARCLLMPESLIFGTGCCRALICMGSSMPYNMGTRYVPSTLDIAIKLAKFFSGQALDQSLAGRPNSEVDSLKIANFNWIAAAESTKSRFWNNGLNYVQYYSMNGIHWPAIRTVYTEETSALINAEFVLAIVFLKQAALELYTTYSNVAMSFPRLKSLLEDAITVSAQKIINSKYPFSVTVYRTEEEELLGFVTHVSLELIAPATNRVMKFDIVVKREDAE